MSTPSVAHAQAHPVETLPFDQEPATPRMMGLGGRAEAAGTSTSAMFGNPAVMTAARTYHSDAYFLYDSPLNRFSFGSAVVDSTRQYLSAGLSYLYTLNNPTGGTSYFSHDSRLNLGLSLSQWLGLGVSARYLTVQCSDGAVQDGCGPRVPNGSLLANDPTESPQRPWSGLLLDAGLFIRPAQFVTLSVSGHNLTNPNVSSAPIYMDVSIAINPMPSLTIVADSVVDFRTRNTTTARWSGGAELLLANHFPIRLGYIYDTTRSTTNSDGTFTALQAITAGLGYLDQTFGAEISLRQGFGAFSETTAIASLRYFYQGAM